MNTLLFDVSEQEKALTEVLKKEVLSQEDEVSISYLLSRILSMYFASLEKETGFRRWSIDDMVPDSVQRTISKLTLVGNIAWLDGGGECRKYQADIATDTSPILYSIKLQNKHGHQILYFSKTFTGWVLNAETDKTKP